MCRWVRKVDREVFNITAITYAGLVFLNFYGAQESIPEESITPASVAWYCGSLRQPYSYLVPSPHRLFKNSNTVYMFLMQRQNLECSHCKEISVHVFPERELRGLSVPMSTFMCLWAIYIFFIQYSLIPIFLQQNRQTDCRNIYRSQKLECRKLDWVRAVLFLGIFVFDFWYCVFAVHRPKQPAFSTKRDLLTQAHICRKILY